MPPDAPVFFGNFGGFLDSNFQYTKGVITGNQAYELYDADIRYDTVYCWSVREQNFKPYTGCIVDV